MKGTPMTETAEQVKTIPYAARYLECSGDMYAECRQKGYNGVCWIDRTDFSPTMPQQAIMGGRAT
jgi:hypothetical protein